LLEANPLNVTGALGYFVKPLERAAVKYLDEIKVPVLVLVGEYDIPDVHAHSGVIEAGIPNAKREIIFKAGHLIPLEQPEAFNASVLIFLSGLEFLNILNSQGVDSAVQYFHKKREAEPDVILFEEREMNLLGYRYLQNGKIKDAIELFKLNTIAFPDSWNAYDSLGEAYLQDGQKDLAIKNYEKSLELNPQNTNAQEKLRSIMLKADPFLLKISDESSSKIEEGEVYAQELLLSKEYVYLEPYTTLFFSSKGDIYWVSTKIIYQLKPEKNT